MRYERGSLGAGQAGGSWRGEGVRLLARVLMLGLGLCALPASAQVVTFSSGDPDLPNPNQFAQASMPPVPQTPVAEIDWGEPVWIRAMGPFPPTGGEYVFRFWRADTAVVDSTNQQRSPYGFAVLAQEGNQANQPTVGFRIGQKVTDIDPDPVVQVLRYDQGILQVVVPGAAQPSFRPAPGSPAGEPGALRDNVYYNPEQPVDQVYPAGDLAAPPGTFTFQPGVVMAPGEWRFRIERDLGGGNPFTFPPYNQTPNFFRFIVRNPVALMHAGPNGPEIANPGRLWDYEGTGAGATAPQGNGNPNFETRGNADKLFERYVQGAWQVPTLGDADHGRTSLYYSFFIADRSRWGVDASGTHVEPPAGPISRISDALRVRVAAGDLNPNPNLTGAPGSPKPPTNMVQADNLALDYGDPDYPAMPGSCVEFRGFGGQNPVAEGAPVTIPQFQAGTFGSHATTRTFGYQVFRAAVKVPRYQPDTFYLTGAPAIGAGPNALPPSDPVRVWVDTNGDGLLNTLQLNPVPPATANQGQPSGYEEVYRELDLSVYVPPDFRFTVVETTVDLGKHAHNQALLSGEPPTRAVRSFTVRNDGNVNLISLRVAHDYLIEGAAARTPVSLYCPDTDYDLSTGSTQGLGLRILPADASGRPHFWWSFAPRFTGDTNQWASGGFFRPGYLAKAQVGAANPTTTAAQVTNGVYEGPRVGVVTPFGTPAGTYANRYFVYEDRYPTVAGNSTLDYRAVSGAFQALEPIAQDPFTLKITVTDRQLTEEAGAFGIDRPRVGLTSTIDGSVVTAPAFLLGGDSQPAVARFWDPNDNTQRRMSLFWTSNRRPWPNNLPLWYLYHARTSESPASPTWPFWGLQAPADTPNPPEPVLQATLFPTMANPNTTEKEERYVSPSVALTQSSVQGDTPGYLFFQATANARQPNPASDGAATQRAYGLYCLPLDADRRPAGGAAPMPVGRESVGVVRHGVKGLSYRDVDAQLQNAGTPRLWAFWHGGPENAWHGYYSSSTDGGRNWTREERLPVYGDFTCVQDMTPVYWSGFYTYYDVRSGQWVNDPRDMIDVYFSGFSKYRRNSDVYLARIDPRDLTRGSWGAWRAKRPFAPVRQEVLLNTNDRVFAAQHLEWATSPYVYPVTNEPVFPRIGWRVGNNTVWLTPDPAVALNPQVANDPTQWWTYNAADSSYTWKFANYQSVNNPDLNGRNTITLYPMAGVVVFAKPMDQGEILADYIPQILRVAASPQLETSPCAFIDTRVGPAQNPTNGTRAYFRRDRMWAFWTRVAPQVSNPTVWAKTMRLMVQLPTAIQSPPAGAFGPVTVTCEFGPITQFTVDAAGGRLFFPTYQDVGGAGFSLEGRKVVVTYTAAGGAQVTFPNNAAQDAYIRWRDEQPEAPLPIDVIANEGKVHAFPDLAHAVDWSSAASIADYLNDMGTWRVWVFWASSRPKVTVNAGVPADPLTYQPVQFSPDTDLRYMTLAPRLDFRPTLPPAP